MKGIGLRFGAPWPELQDWWALQEEEGRACRRGSEVWFLFGVLTLPVAGFQSGLSGWIICMYIMNFEP